MKEGIRINLSSGKIHKIGKCGYSNKISQGNYEDFFTVAEAECRLESKRITGERCKICFGKIET